MKKEEEEEEMFDLLIPVNEAEHMNSMHNLSRNKTVGNLEDDFFMYLTIVNSIIGVLIYIVNGLLICFFACNRRVLLSTPTHRLLLSLAICDFLHGIGITCQVVMRLYPELMDVYAYRIIVDIYTTFLVNSVVFHLCGLTLDRYLSLFYALEYRSIVTPTFLNRYITVAWLLPLLTSVVQLSWLYCLFDGGQGCSIDDIEDIEIWYSVATFTIFLVIPMTLLGAAFIRMYLEIRRLILNTPNPRMRTMTGISARQRRIIYVFGLMYMSFIVLALPYFSLRVMEDLLYWAKKHYGQRNFLSTPVMRRLKFLQYTLKLCTSLLNPLLYGSNTQEIRLLVAQYFSKSIRTIRSQTFTLSVRRKSSLNISSTGDLSINVTSYDVTSYEQDTDNEIDSL